MTRRKQDNESTQQDILARRERAHRILDAAAVLILRWGYNKTNVEDIANQAGVGKGTIYLHWKTRDDLFRALIHREQLLLAADFRQRVGDDPAGATLRGIYKHYAYALMQRPLLKAFILRDTDALGKYAQGEHSTEAFVERMAGFQAHLEFLRQHGLVRDDLPIREQVYILSAIFMGFYFIAPLMPPEFSLSDTELAERMADTVQRALESGRSASLEELGSITSAFQEHLDRGIALYEAQFQEELDS